MVLALVLVAALQPARGQGQFEVSDLCTLYQSTTLTEDVVSTLSEDWDSGDNSWASRSRTIVTYEGENPTELLFQERIRSAWRDTSRVRGTYDGSGRLTRCTLQERKNEGFVNSFRLEFEYADGRNPQRETTQVWDTTDAFPEGGWVNASRSEFTRDGSGNLTERVDQGWNRDRQEWVNSTRIRNTYDSQGRRTVHLVEQAAGSDSWTPSMRTRNTYGPDGISEALTETWNLTTSSWENDERTQYSYPSADQTVAVFQDWDASQWVNEERTTTDLNDSGLIIRETEEVWAGSAWANSTRSDISYKTLDDTDKLAQIVEQNWDDGESDWINSDRTTYSYDSIIPVELASFDGVLEGQDVVLRWRTLSESNNAGFSVQHRAEVAKAWAELSFVASKAPGGSTDRAQSYRYVASELSPGTHDFRLEQVDLDGSTTLSEAITVEVAMQQALRLSGPVPNPVSNVASLSFAVKDRAEARVTVYNVLGQLVRTLFRGAVAAGREHDVRFDTKGLPNGMYFVRLEAGGQTRTERVTVVR